MIKYYILLLMAFSAFTVSSCDFFRDSETQKNVEVKYIVELPDTVKQHLIKQDSLYSGLIAKIETLTNELNTAQQNVAQLKRNHKTLENLDWNYMTVGAIILSVLAIILSILAIVLRGNALGENDVHRNVKAYLDNSTRLKELQSKVLDLERTKSTNSSSKYMPTGPVSRKAEDRIVYLEGKIKEVIDAVHRHENEIKTCGGVKTTPPSTPPTTPPKRPEFSKEGYAKLNSGAFFLEILDSNQEGCVFHIKFKSENKGEFDIISLDKIKSRNGWQEVVETTGNCTMEDATSYKVEDKGICEKLSDGKTWEMKRKLKIKISK